MARNHADTSFSAGFTLTREGGTGTGTVSVTAGLERAKKEVKAEHTPVEEKALHSERDSECDRDIYAY